MSCSPDKTLRPAAPVSFADFWVLVSIELSHARLHLNRDAKSLEQFISKRSDVRIYLHESVKESYKKSACQHLRSPISFEAVLDILGEKAFQLQRGNAGDLFDIELLEEIAWLICDRFPDQVIELVTRTEAWDNSNKDEAATCGRIISFPDYKIRKANSNL